jgi:hypothetical protein
MEHDRFYMMDISLQVKELLCLFKEAHVSIRTQVFCPSPKGNSYQALNNASMNFGMLGVGYAVSHHGES